ncbi:hypothetical protein SDC9_141576 [bioreactor metagenome]|uniref:Uncharacterized protein n=1 Tax=bioreactor metagenome TaxID=1076179 RepID=A0A645DY33_9ZZZZ
MELFDAIISGTKTRIEPMITHRWGYHTADAWADTGKNELVMQRDAAYELGGGENPFEEILGISVALMLRVAGGIHSGQEFRRCLQHYGDDPVGSNIRHYRLELVQGIRGKAPQEIGDHLLARTVQILSGDALGEIFEELLAAVAGDGLNGLDAGLKAERRKGACDFLGCCEIRGGGHVRNSFRYYQRAYRNDQGGFEKSLPLSGRLPMPWPVENQDVGCRCFFLVPVEPEDPRAEAF